MPKVLTTFSAALLFAGISNAPAALVLQLQAQNYNPATGTWTATVGSNALQATTANRPALGAGQTINASPAVQFDGTDFLTLGTPIPNSASGYTAFAYLRTPNSAVARTIFAGGNGSFQYRIGGDGLNLRQQNLRRGQVNLAGSSTDLSTTAFNNINSSITSGAGGSIFRLNGNPDGTDTDPGAFTADITQIGAGSGPNEFFVGDIAEIRIYDSILTLAERQAVETQFLVSLAPEPGVPFLLGAGASFFALFHRRRSIPLASSKLA